MLVNEIKSNKLELLDIGISPIFVKFIDDGITAIPFILKFKLELKNKKPIILRASIYKNEVTNQFLDTIDTIKAFYQSSGRKVSFNTEDIKLIKSDISELMPNIISYIENANKID